jgi:hypothetical protein
MGEAELEGETARHRVFVDRAPLDQHLAEAPPRLPLLLQGGVDGLARDVRVFDQKAPEDLRLRLHT